MGPRDVRERITKTRQRGFRGHSHRWRVGLVWPPHRAQHFETAKDGARARVKLCWRTPTSRPSAPGGLGWSLSSGDVTRNILDREREVGRCRRSLHLTHAAERRLDPQRSAGPRGRQPIGRNHHRHARTRTQVLGQRDLMGDFGLAGASVQQRKPQNDPAVAGSRPLRSQARVSLSDSGEVLSKNLGLKIHRRLVSQRQFP